MNFRVTRTSDSLIFNRDKVPCEGAVYREEWIRRTHMGQYWMTSGKDHGESEEEGRFGTYLDQWWEIEIPDLTALVLFTDKYGEIVLSGQTIEIYDDYRE